MIAGQVCQFRNEAAGAKETIVGLYVYSLQGRMSR
jgi:hypothetical protein